MTELHYQSLSDTCRQLKSGALSAVTLTEHMLARIRDLDGDFKSFALVLSDSALQRARELDLMRAEGKPLGPLHGVPVAVKDLVYTRGVPTGSGTRVMADFRPDFDGSVLTRLQDAGAVIIGKTQLTEGAFGMHHPDIPAPVNPYGLATWPGVSSSGSGVAVAAGLAFGALGTDTGGSIRFPSACCGLVGIKPTYGRVSRHGVFPLAGSLDHVGPMTRTVEDAARMLSVIAGHDPQDSTSLDAPVPNYAAVGVRAHPLVIGVDWDYIGEGVDPDVVDVIKAALDRFGQEGARIEPFSMPGEYRRLVDEWGITCGVECAAAHAGFYPARKAEYGPALSQLIETGLAAAQSHYQELEALRGVFRAKLDRILSGLDVIIAPCMTCLPPDAAQMTGEFGGDGRAPFITFTAPFDYSGHPTITLPAGLSERGLPLSFQLIGRHLDEATLVQAGLAHERALGAMPHPGE